CRASDLKPGYQLPLSQAPVALESPTYVLCAETAALLRATPRRTTITPCGLSVSPSSPSPSRHPPSRNLPSSFTASSPPVRSTRADSHRGSRAASAASTPAHPESTTIA